MSTSLIDLSNSVSRRCKRIDDAFTVEARLSAKKRHYSLVQLLLLSNATTNIPVSPEIAHTWLATIPEISAGDKFSHPLFVALKSEAISIDLTLHDRQFIDDARPWAVAEEYLYLAEDPFFAGWLSFSQLGILGPLNVDDARHYIQSTFLGGNVEIDDVIALSQGALRFVDKLANFLSTTDDLQSAATRALVFLGPINDFFGYHPGRQPATTAAWAEMLPKSLGVFRRYRGNEDFPSWLASRIQTIKLAWINALHLLDLEGPDLQ